MKHNTLCDRKCDVLMHKNKTQHESTTRATKSILTAHDPTYFRDGSVTESLVVTKQINPTSTLTERRAPPRCIQFHGWNTEIARAVIEK